MNDVIPVAPTVTEVFSGVFGEKVSQFVEVVEANEGLSVVALVIHRAATVSYMDIGWGNGYVAVDETHPLFGVHYDEIDLRAHGGLTYSEPHTINGVKFWVFGFDTAHYMDNLETCPKEYVVECTRKLFADTIQFAFEHKQIETVAKEGHDGA